MGVLARHPFPAAICGVAIAATAGFFLFARPQYRPPHQGTNIRIPDKRPAADASGRAGWVWPDGVPGWEPGQLIEDYPVSGMQAIEAQPARLAAAHAMLDAEQVRVLVGMHIRPGEGPLAILAAPQLDTSPSETCLAAMVPRGTAIGWRCPGASYPHPDVARARVFAATVAVPWPGSGDPRMEGTVGLYLAGVARGDVRRVALRDGGTDRALYDRGATWGQFSAAETWKPGDAIPELRVYGDHGLVQVLELDVRPGEQRIYR